MTNSTTFTWEEINAALFGIGWSPRRLVRLMMALPRGQETYTWETINSALMARGSSMPVIVRAMRALGGK